MKKLSIILCLLSVYCALDAGGAEKHARDEEQSSPQKKARVQDMLEQSILKMIEEQAELAAQASKELVGEEKHFQELLARKNALEKELEQSKEAKSKALALAPPTQPKVIAGVKAAPSPSKRSPRVKNEIPKKKKRDKSSTNESPQHASKKSKTASGKKSAGPAAPQTDSQSPSAPKVSVLKSTGGLSPRAVRMEAVGSIPMPVEHTTAESKKAEVLDTSDDSSDDSSQDTHQDALASAPESSPAKDLKSRLPVIAPEHPAPAVLTSLSSEILASSTEQSAVPTSLAPTVEIQKSENGAVIAALLAAKAQSPVVPLSPAKGLDAQKSDSPQKVVPRIPSFGKIRPTLSAIQSLCYCAATDEIIVGCSDRSLKKYKAESLYTAAQPLIKKELAGNVHAAISMKVDSRNPERIATGSNEGVIRVWDVAKEHCCATLVGHKGRVALLYFYPADGTTLISAGQDRTIRMWDLAKGVCMHTFELEKPIDALVFLEDLPTIGFAASGSKLIIIDFEQKAVITTIDGCTPTSIAALCAYRNPDYSAYLVLGTKGGTLITYNIEEGYPVLISEVPVTAAPIIELGTDPYAATQLVCRSVDNTITLYDTITSSPVVAIKASVMITGFIVGKTHIIVASTDGQLYKGTITRNESGEITHISQLESLSL